MTNIELLEKLRKGALKPGSPLMLEQAGIIREKMQDMKNRGLADMNEINSISKKKYV